MEKTTPSGPATAPTIAERFVDANSPNHHPIRRGPNLPNSPNRFMFTAMLRGGEEVSQKKTGLSLSESQVGPGPCVSRELRSGRRRLGGGIAPAAHAAYVTSATARHTRTFRVAGRREPRAAVRPMRAGVSARWCECVGVGVGGCGWCSVTAFETPHVQTMRTLHGPQSRSPRRRSGHCYSYENSRTVYMIFYVGIVGLFQKRSKRSGASSNVGG